MHIDIANDPVDAKEYKKEEDPQYFKSQKTGRGPLTGQDWAQKSTPVMTCYKVVTVEFKWFGIQNNIENMIHKVFRVFQLF